jgi:purine-binding chemotaxis protein CheW
VTGRAEDDSFEALVATLGDVRLALPSACVVEVARMVATAPLPGAPPIVEGAIGYRGTVVPVLDLRRRLGLPARGVDPADHLVVIRTDGRRVALRVDRALGLVSIDRASLVPAERLARGVGRIAGAWLSSDGALVVARPDRFLDEAEERSLAAALEAAP